MPIYEYECEVCKNTTEVWEQSPAERLTTCLRCGSRRIHRIISKTSFRLGGGYWERNGYGKNKMEKETKVREDCINCQYGGAKREDK